MLSLLNRPRYLITLFLWCSNFEYKYIFIYFLSSATTVLIGKLSSVKTTPKPEPEPDAKKIPKPPKPGGSRKNIQGEISFKVFSILRIRLQLHLRCASKLSGAQKKSVLLMKRWHLLHTGDCCHYGFRCLLRPFTLKGEMPDLFQPS